MFVVITRNFPPDIGGIQSLMEGLTKGLLNHAPVKIFADDYLKCNDYDQNSNLEIQRIGGFKVFRKFRKAYMVNEYLKTNTAKAIFFDHWKSLEYIKTDYLNKSSNFCLIHSKEINHPIGSSLNTRMNKAFKKAEFIIANSKYTKELGVNVGLEEKKIHIIHPGTNYPAKIHDKDKSEDSWTDTNVSEHPKFYNADLKDELTNIGAFFDKNNQYNDTTSSNTESLPSDSCYTDKSGNYYCQDKTRLQLIPPKLITDPDNCYALNDIDNYKENNNDTERVMNGGLFYNDVNASSKHNENWSDPIKNQIGSCSV